MLMENRQLINLYPQQLDYHQIIRLVPYRSPWLLIDNVVRWDEKSIVVNKAISGADPMMAAHLADGPSIMPGVLLIEFMGQATMLLSTLTSQAPPSEQTAVLGRCKGEFISPARIGELITGYLSITDVVAGKTFYEGVIFAGERKVCKVSGVGAFLSKGGLDE
ncbi:hypothetical protein LOZ86_17585 [Pectobacterium parvum]|uniref:3-hydroxyacyl-ACP dehydratase FabZ family protein n=1 Tax=Pectobacterium parvum TaxID=2778550 RepID=A0AAP9IEH1_9GAMM|nr:MULTISPECIES: hypothetical protein [Pectobacterium]QHQ23019.1 hypothetical protein GMX10_02245 [Pectobacterium parvum]UFK38695.1 hypothetical protein LOZ86_17585 [Pectobacterium parvum]UVD96809.1 hypothetical protein NV347_17600 [Pectobacterium parvum]GKW41791.1 3-hydroxyacyl-[acyl-carrier-protein] dehydratase FabZ [Pectobacterium carotovorum subsp. carotovorum]